MSKLTYQQAVEKAKAYDKELLATDKRFRTCVQLSHEEGSTFFWKYAFAMKLEDWIVVFTEHHSFHVYHKEDVYSCEVFKQIYDDLDEIK